MRQDCIFNLVPKSPFRSKLPLCRFEELLLFLPKVYGKHVTIYVDHLSLVQAFNSNNLPLNDPQSYRQITEIGRFTKDMRHISGIDNIFADFLSRIREENKGSAYQAEEDVELEVAAEEVQFQLVSLDVLQDLQATDPEVKRIRSGEQPRSATFSQVEIEGRSLFCETSSTYP